MQHHNEKNEFDLYAVWQAIAKRKKIVAVVFLAIVLGTTVTSLVLPKIYRTTALLVVDFGEELIIPSNAKEDEDKNKNSNRIIDGGDIIALVRGTDKMTIFPTSHQYVQKLKITEFANKKNRVMVTIGLFDEKQSKTVLTELVNFLNNQEDIKRNKAYFDLQLVEALAALGDMEKLKKWEQALGTGRLVTIGFNPILIRKMMVELTLRKKLLKNFLDSGERVKVVVASTSSEAVSPRIVFNTFIAMFFGLLLSVGVALLLGYTERMKNSQEQQLK